MLASGLLGGLIGAGLAYGASRYLPAASDPGLADRMASLERRVGALPAQAPSLEPRVVALEGAIRQAGEDARAARAAAEAAAKQAADAASRPASAAPAPDPALRQDLAALAARLDEAARHAGANAEAVADLGRKLDALGTRTDERLSATTSALEGAQGALQTAQGAVQGLRTDVGALRTAGAAAETRLAEGEARLAKLSTDLSRVSGDVAKLSPTAVQAGLRVVVAGRLEDTLRAGAPLGPAIAALERLGADPGSLTALKPFAETVPVSAAALAADFKPLADQMTAEPRPPTETLGDRLRRLLGKVVTVRAVGDGSGTDVPGLVARIEAALARGALSEAASLWDRLPDRAKGVSAAWAERLKTRAAAEDAARRIVAQSLGALDAAIR